MSITLVANIFKLDSKRLTAYYKHHLSDFRKREQADHSKECIFFPDNMGEHISLDETSLNNGELYTVLTYKAGHGKKGTLIALVKGTKSEEVCDWLSEKLPEELRLKVKTITLDMAGSMARIARRCFPKAKQIIDRFHVQKEFKEALQNLRIQYRWQAMEDENRQIRECKERGEAYHSEVFSNGDTKKQLLARSRYILFKNPDDRISTQRQRAEILFEQYDDLKQLYYLFVQLGQIYSTSYDKNVAGVKLAWWFNKVEQWGYPQFNTVVKTFVNHYERILNFYDERMTNASAESFNAKLKQFRATFRGVADPNFFLFRVAKIFA